MIQQPVGELIIARQFILLVEQGIIILQVEPVQVVGRYHSWGFAARNFPDALKILALDDKDQVMAFADIPNKIAAVQFHPESILTENGKAILHNGAKWLLDWSL